MAWALLALSPDMGRYLQGHECDEHNRRTQGVIHRNRELPHFTYRAGLWCCHGTAGPYRGNGLDTTREKAWFWWVLNIHMQARERGDLARKWLPEHLPETHAVASPPPLP